MKILRILLTMIVIVVISSGFTPTVEIEKGVDKVEVAYIGVGDVENITKAITLLESDVDITIVHEEAHTQKTINIDFAEMAESFAYEVRPPLLEFTYNQANFNKINSRYTNTSFSNNNRLKANYARRGKILPRRVRKTQHRV